eukprot:TRINITY_DN18333_c0_g1_i1.p1 TRINITY_DN18333_c0_g1~~TRINITY_DN18333_c0_g1_i1.p1  ORF type:complete len:659 (+),score=136.34 TRINITY_DN18333_c0_g1_i1:78-2054(+)
MRKLTMLLSALLLCTAKGSDGECLTYGGESWLGMLSWVSAGVSPRWVVQDGGKTVHQYVNSPYPGFYVSDEDDLINIVITGTVEVRSVPGLTQDDDFIGISVGHKYPLPGADTVSKFDTMLFAWGGQGEHAEATITKLNGTFAWDYTEVVMPLDCVDCFFQRYEPSAETSRQDHGCFSSFRTSHGDSGGWKPDQINTFALLFTEELLQVKINNKLTLNVTQSDLDDWCDANAKTPEHLERCKGGWRKGRIAWYNFSQNGVIYGNVRMFRVQPKSQIPNATAEAPKIVSDFYTIQREGGNLVDINVPYHEGILKNDHSPELLNLTIFIAVNGSADIEVNNQDTAFETNSGNPVVMDPSGAFTYKPPMGGTEASEDYFEYYVVDNEGRRSFQETAKVTFALPPVVSTGFEIRYQMDADMQSQEPSWFDSLTKGTRFGKAIATAGCGAIVDWKLSNGGAQGRFSLSSVHNGAEVLVADPSRLLPQTSVAQKFSINVTATDIYGQVSSIIVPITVPARMKECDPKCEGKSLCVDGTCQCSDVTLQYPDCDKCIPPCNENETCSSTATCECSPGFDPPDCTPPPEKVTDTPKVIIDNSLSCAVFAVGGQCLGWLVIVLIIVLILFLLCSGYVYTHRGVHTTNKKKGGKMKSYELDSRYLEGLQ